MAISDERVIQELEHVMWKVARIEAELNDGGDREELWGEAILVLTRALALITAADVVEREQST